LVIALIVNGARMKRAFFISIICFCAALWNADAQSSRIIFATGGSNLFLLDTAGGACTYIQYGVIECQDTTNFIDPFSIAIYKDTIYANDVKGNLYQSVIGSSPYCVLLKTQVYTDALTVDKNGDLFWISYGNSLITYNPHTNKICDLGILNFTPSGDLLFYQDRLLMSSSDAKLIEINIEHPERSISLMETSGHLFYGLANTNQDCKQYNIFGFESVGNGTNIIELNMSTKKITGLFCTLPLDITDVASERESGGYDCDCHIYVPNAFTPNHDGLNDILRPVVRCSSNVFLSEFIFRIFNRWGQLVFSTLDQNTGWTGNFSGLTGNKMKQKGSFILLK